MRALESGGDVGLVHHHEAFFNGSLILTTEDDKLREERHYRQLLDRTTVSWIDNCATPEALVGNFISAIMKEVDKHERRGTELALSMSEGKPGRQFRWDPELAGSNRTVPTG